MLFLRSNTAVIIAVGPFFDKTDGVTLETGLTITNERITLIAETDAGSAPTIILDNVTGALSGTANDLSYITGQDNGMMQLELAAADVNRVGRMKLSITDAANHVPVFHELFVLPQAIYDWLTGVIVPLPANVTQLLGTAWLTPGTAGTPDVNAKLLGGTAQTGRDIGASVLLSSGSGAGQLDFTSGVVKASLVQILGTAITGTASQLAAAFTKFFDKAAPTGTINSLPDAVPDAAGGLPVTGNRLTAIPTVANVTLVATTTTLTNAPPDSAGVTTLLARLPAAFFAGITSLAQWLGLIAGKQVGNSTARTEMRATGAGSGTFDETTDSTEAIRDNMGTPQTGDVFPLASTEIADIKAKTDNLPSDPADESLIIAATDAIMTRIGAAGSGLTALGDARLANLDAAVTTRLASGTVAADVTAVKAKTDNLPEGVKKNTALSNVMVKMIDSSDHVTAKTGLTITATRSLDGGAFGACANSASEVSNGWYKIDLAAGDLNGTIVVIRFTGTGADASEIEIKTCL